jgi:hypothetical protein
VKKIISPKKLQKMALVTKKLLVPTKRLKTGLPDGIFSNQKNSNLGKFWNPLKWKTLVYFMPIWNILQ